VKNHWISPALLSVSLKYFCFLLLYGLQYCRAYVKYSISKAAAARRIFENETWYFLFSFKYWIGFKRRIFFLIPLFNVFNRSLFTLSSTHECNTVASYVRVIECGFPRHFNIVFSSKCTDFGLSKAMKFSAKPNEIFRGFIADLCSRVSLLGRWRSLKNVDWGGKLDKNFVTLFRWHNDITKMTS